MEAIGFINMLIGIYFLINAKKHEKNGVLWALLGCMFGPFAIGLYLIKTGRKVSGWILTIFFGLIIAVFLLMLITVFFFPTLVPV